MFYIITSDILTSVCLFSSYKIKEMFQLDISTVYA